METLLVFALVWTRLETTVCEPSAMFVATPEHALQCLRWSFVAQIQTNMAAIGGDFKVLQNDGEFFFNQETRNFLFQRQFKRAIQ